jgi:Homeodomain-like domain
MAQQVRKWVVRLTAAQRAELERVVRSQKVSALVSRRARILLLADAAHLEGRRTDEYIGERLAMTRRQVQRVRLQFVQRGLPPTLQRQVRSDRGTPKTLDGSAEAQLVTLSCSTPPAGRERWTLQLLVDELCRLQVVTSVCRETVRKTLKKIA